MGFRIQSNYVLVEHENNAYSDTRVASNPTTINTKDGLLIHILFKRLSKGNTDNTKLGDNCPLIYALKGIEELTISYSQFKLFYMNFCEILSKFREQNTLFDFVIPIPSSSNISNLLARKVSEMITESTLHTSLLRKITVSECYDLIRPLRQDRRHKKMLMKIDSELKRQQKTVGVHGSFSMKKIKLQYREYIQPIALNVHSFENPSPRILLVDDLVSSGTTLQCAKSVIISSIPEATVDAITLFGPMNNKLR